MSHSHWTRHTPIGHVTLPFDMSHSHWTCHTPIGHVTLPLDLSHSHCSPPPPDGRPVFRLELDEQELQAFAGEHSGARADADEITVCEQALAVTRSIGDFYAHSYGLTHAPEVRTISISELHRRGDARLTLALATDGLWDLMSHEEASLSRFPDSPTAHTVSHAPPKKSFPSDHHE